MRAYKTEIDPTSSQIELIHKTFGCTRYIYNQFVFENLENLASDKDYISAFDYSKRVNNDPNTPTWLKEVPSKAVKQALIYADRAFKDYFSKRRGKPKFKKKGLSESFYLIGTIKVERHRIFVPVLKWIRLKEFGYIPKNITSVTISMKSGRYYISCLCKDEIDERIPLSDYSMGIDFGLKDQFITEDRVIPSINKSLRIRKLEQRLRREQRKLSRKYEANMVDKVYYKTGAKKGQLKSYKWLKPLSECKNIQKQKLKVARIYERLTRIRTEYNRKALRSLVLERKPNSITIEDLAVRNMMKNRHLSKTISNAQWYQSRLYLENLCKKLGIELRLVSRFYPSSKLCSDCGFKYKDLKLNERTWICSNCGSKHDRDVNAAINLGQSKEYTVLTAV
jgi:transposase, IS605 orfB family